MQLRQAPGPAGGLPDKTDQGGDYTRTGLSVSKTGTGDSLLARGMRRFRLRSFG